MRNILKNFLLALSLSIVALTELILTTYMAILVCVVSIVQAMLLQLRMLCEMRRWQR